MAVDDMNLLADEDLTQYGKRAEDSWEGRRAIDNPVRQMIHLETVRQVANTGSAGVGVRDDDDVMAAIYELL